MRDAGQHKVRAITLAFEQYRGTAKDEAPLAAQVAERYGAGISSARSAKRNFAATCPQSWPRWTSPRSTA